MDEAAAASHASYRKVSTIKFIERNKNEFTNTKFYKNKFQILFQINLKIENKVFHNNNWGTFLIFFVLVFLL